ncbi:NifB/NifX family molybdenum-iron cluster-binding protein [Pseudodesulfovibrio sp.]|uniref:NifB/NifX family molybdenum-iron cluster-binding protein n=1 Tax=Pseudodesulfovibrio sp. TaxID=2035812 RepID=UPI00262E6A2D|nr:NifB/NifX family molybdenum-iron cluster-binding protein [Pseudodesulfovibrio sp.]MDD3312214.1 NifB/NifX family molybdenum-iron cluster-binding protein [Pseudodesulfovibrio sp.]
MEKILIPLLDSDVAPRFDLATDVLVVSFSRETLTMGTIKEKVVVLNNASSEAACRLALSENVRTVICAGIEAEYHDFLTWKGIKVLDDVCGPVDLVLESYLTDALEKGMCFY